MSLSNIYTFQGRKYHLENVPGDGNCFFHCLSVLQAGDYSCTKEFRHQICQTIFNNWDEWHAKASLFHGPQITKYTYWGTMLKCNGWATSCEIELAAKTLGWKINVWLKGTDGTFVLTSFTPQMPHNTITLLLENNHFQILHEIPGYLSPAPVVNDLKYTNNNGTFINNEERHGNRNSSENISQHHDRRCAADNHSSCESEGIPLEHAYATAHPCPKSSGSTSVDDYGKGESEGIPLDHAYATVNDYGNGESEGIPLDHAYATVDDYGNSESEGLPLDHAYATAHHCPRPSDSTSSKGNFDGTFFEHTYASKRNTFCKHSSGHTNFEYPPHSDGKRASFLSDHSYFNHSTKTRHSRVKTKHTHIQKTDSNNKTNSAQYNNTSKSWRKRRNLGRNLIYSPISNKIRRKNQANPGAQPSAPQFREAKVKPKRKIKNHNVQKHTVKTYSKQKTQKVPFATAAIPCNQEETNTYNSSEEITQNYSILSPSITPCVSDSEATQNYSSLNKKELDLLFLCQDCNVDYQFPSKNETLYQGKQRRLRLQHNIATKRQKKLQKLSCFQCAEKWEFTMTSQLRMRIKLRKRTERDA